MNTKTINITGQTKGGMTPTNQGRPSSPEAAYLIPNSDLEMLERVIVPAHPEWGTAVVSSVDDPYFVLISFASDSGRPALRVGRAAVRRHIPVQSDARISADETVVACDGNEALHSVGTENPVLQPYSDIFGKLGKSPSKPLLLLAVLSEIDAGRLKSNNITFPSALSGPFNHLWKVLVSDDSLPCDISLPFRDLSRHGWWTLLKGGKPVDLGESGFTFGATPLVKLVDGARFSDDLWELLIRWPSRNELRIKILHSSFPLHDANIVLQVAAPASVAITRDATSHSAPTDSRAWRKPHATKSNSGQDSGANNSEKAPNSAISRLTNNRVDTGEPSSYCVVSLDVARPVIHAQSCSAALIEEMLNDLERVKGDTDRLASTLARIGDLPCSFAWNDEYRLANKLVGIADVNADQIALNRLIRLYAFSDGVLPFSIRAKDILRRGISDRCDIACLIAAIALGQLSPTYVRAHTDRISVGLDHVQQVYSRTSMYYPAEYLYADALRRQGLYKEAADIAIELHRRAGATLGDPIVASWPKDYQRPRVVARKALRMLLFKQRAEPDTLAVISNLELLAQLGVVSQTERDTLASLCAFGPTILTPPKPKHQVQGALSLPVTEAARGANRDSSLRSNTGPGPTRSSAIVGRLYGLMRDIGEPAHYSALAEMYEEAYGEASVAQLVDALKSNPSLFRQVADGTFIVALIAKSERHWVLDTIIEATKSTRNFNAEGSPQ